MATKKKEEQILVLTPAFRVSFPNVFKPRAAFDNQAATYNIQMLFPKTVEGIPEQLRQFGTNLDTIKQGMVKACTQEWGPKEQWPTFKHRVIRDGAEKQDLEQYQGNWFINSKSKFQPGVIDREKNEITDPELFYPGCWARANLNVYTYDNKFGAGVQLGLVSLQFLMDGESFANKRNAKDDFDVIEGFEDDAFSTSGSEETSSDAMYNDF